jgi:predicted aminopeptidase
MRSYCKLSDAELAVKDPARARQYANAALPFLDKFNVTSPSLLVLRDLGFCFESEGAVQHRVSIDRELPSAERLTAGAESRRWYSKAAEAWSTWNARGAATPESERERHRVENLLKGSGPVLRLSETEN